MLQGSLYFIANHWFGFLWFFINVPHPNQKCRKTTKAMKKVFVSMMIELYWIVSLFQQERCQFVFDLWVWLSLWYLLPLFQITVMFVCRFVRDTLYLYWIQVSYSFEYIINFARCILTHHKFQDFNFYPKSAFWSTKTH